MEQQLFITPVPVGDNRGFAFDCKELNTIARAEYQDTFGFYQNTFRIFSYMKLNRLRKYVVNQIKGTPLVWKTWTGCSYDNTGTLTHFRKELIPQAAYMRESWCHDELLSSFMEHFIDWPESGDIQDLSPEGISTLNTLTNELMANAAEGSRISLLGGSMYDVNAVEPADGTSAEEFSAFKKTHGTFKGIVKLAYDLADSGLNPWLNLGLTDPTDFDESGFTGDILALYDQLKSAASSKLKKLINQGGIVRSGLFNFLPLFVVSDSFFNAVVSKYNDLQAQAATNGVRITQRIFGAANSATPQVVFYIDGVIPVIPLSQVNGYDEYINADTHFATIVASGNMQLGTSFGEIPENIENPNIGLMVERNNESYSENWGQWVWNSHILGAATIADPNFMVATIDSTLS